MSQELEPQNRLPSWPIAAALGISGFLFFLYLYTLIAPIIRDPTTLAPHSTRQAGASKKKSKPSWLSRLLFGPGTRRRRQRSRSRSSRPTVPHDPESLLSSSAPHSRHAHTHARFPSSPSSAGLFPHPITPYQQSFNVPFNPSYAKQAPLTQSISSLPTGVHVRGGQDVLSPPPPAYVSGPNTPSPDYVPAFIDQRTAYAFPPLSPRGGDGTSNWNHHTPSQLPSPSGSSSNGAPNGSPSSIPQPSPSYNTSMSSASRPTPSSQVHATPPSRHVNLNSQLTQALPRGVSSVNGQPSPPRVVTYLNLDNKEKGDEPFSSVRTTGSGPFTPKITTSASANAIGSQSTRYRPPSGITTQPPAPPVSALASSFSSQPHQPPPHPSQSQSFSPSHAPASRGHPRPPRTPHWGKVSSADGGNRTRMRESLSDSAVHSLTTERVSKQPIVAPHMYPRNASGAPILHVPSASLGGTAKKS